MREGLWETETSLEVFVGSEEPPAETTRSRCGEAQLQIEILVEFE